MGHYDALFQELQVGRSCWKNRIVLSPMGDGKANPDGSIGEDYIAYYERVAKGGAAVITPGVLCVDYPNGKALPNTARMDDIKYVYPYSMFADRIHLYEALLIPQIHHAGPQTFSVATEGLLPKCVTDAEPEHAGHKGYRTLGAQQELTLEEIKALVQKFVTTAVYCKMAGCDGVTLHASHGYLISSFFSPDTNKRTDEYGGSFENRVRFAQEIVMGIRAACGPNFVVGARIPGNEFTSDGLTQEECIRIAQVMEDAGCDYLDISFGTVKDANRLIETPRFPQGVRVEYAAAIKKAVKKAKVGAVGVLREPEYCDALLREDKVDFVTLGRALLADHQWPNKAKAGKAETIRPCLSCLDGCLKALADGTSIHCAINPTVGREVAASHIQKAATPKKVLVIGGGIAGMQAAITAAERGHMVILAESSDVLGGQMNLACVPPNKQRIAQAKDWFIGELERQGVEVHLNTKADMAFVQSIAPHEIILSSGSVPATAPISGVENAVQAWDVLQDVSKLPEGKDVVVVGGGIVGCEVAEMLIEKKNRVTLLEMLPAIAGGLEGSNLADLMMCFAAGCVNVVTEAMVKEIATDKVVYSKDGKEQSVKSDMTLISTGMKPVGKDLAAELRKGGYTVHLIGDAKRPRKFIDATREGFFAANLI